MKWLPGQTAILHMEFDIDGTLTDPTTVVLKVQDPEGNVDTYTHSLAEVTKIGTGVYEKEIPLDDEGNWLWRWVGTGTVPTADEGNIVVRSSEFVDNNVDDDAP